MLLHFLSSSSPDNNIRVALALFFQARFSTLFTRKYMLTNLNFLLKFFVAYSMSKSNDMFMYLFKGVVN